MTVLFAGGEDTSVVPVGAWSIVVGAGTAGGDGGGWQFRPAFARMALANGNASNSDPPAYRLTTPPFASSASFWVHAQWGCNDSANGTNANAQMLRLLDALGVCRLTVRGTGSAGQLKISKRNAAGTFTDLVTSAGGAWAYNAGAPHEIDLCVNYATIGRATLYVDGEVIADTGSGIDVTTDGATALAQVEYATSQNTGQQIAWSELIVQTSSTIGMALQTVPPVTAGPGQTWTGSAANIDEVVTNDAAFNLTPNYGALSEWIVSATLPIGGWTIEAIVEEARVAIGGAPGPQGFDWLCGTNGGASQSVVAAPTPGASFQNYANIWPVNPVTGLAWVPGDMAAGLSLGIKSLIGGAGGGAGTGQHPHLFDRYPVRPPWPVAGVDYPVGITPGTVLIDWQAMTNPGVGFGTGIVTFYNTNNVVIDGVDFSFHKGAQLYFSNCQGITIQNCRFGGPQYLRSAAGVIEIEADCSNIVIQNNEIDNGGVLALPIASVSNANPAVVVLTEPHGLANGSSIQFSSVTGMTALNGASCGISVIDVVSFSVPIDTTNKTTYPPWSGTGVIEAGGASTILNYSPDTLKFWYNWIYHMPSRPISQGGAGTIDYRYNLIEQGAYAAYAHLKFPGMVRHRRDRILHRRIQHLYPDHRRGRQRGTLSDLLQRLRHDLGDAAIQCRDRPVG